MPELAEVETVARGLRALVARRITAVRLDKTDFIDQPERFPVLLPGSRIDDVRRYGKLLLFALAAGRRPPARLWLMIHLGMTGQLVIRRPGDPAPPHTHVRFELDDGRELRYTDIRRFGRMGIVSGRQLARRLASLGADPLELEEKAFRERLTHRRARVKALLLDQRVLRGLGNIYADESLWRARLHPMRRAADLSEDELAGLWRGIRGVLREAIRCGGTSVANYVDALGQRGTYQQRLQVYRRNGRPCPRCGATIGRLIVAGRASHFCPRCQPDTGRSCRPATVAAASLRAKLPRPQSPA